MRPVTTGIVVLIVGLVAWADRSAIDGRLNGRGAGTGGLACDVLEPV